MGAALTTGGQRELARIHARVLQVVATYPPYHGGTGNAVYGLARELSRRGAHVVVATPAMAYPSRLVENGVEVCRLPVFIRVGMAALMRRFYALNGFDIIHLHTPFLLGGEETVFLSLLQGTPLVVTYHHDLIDKGLRGSLFNTYSRLSLAKTLSRAAAVTVSSLDYARQSRVSQAIFAAKHLVEIPYGVDLGRFSPGQPRVRLGIPWQDHALSRTFLFVAALDRPHYFKGLEVLLEAVSKTRGLHTKLVVVGDGDMRAAYEHTAVRLGIRESVFFAGNVPDELLSDYYRAADCVVVPSTTSSEAFGLTLIEAMACGRAVIASQLAGVRTVVHHRENGFLVPPGDASALAAAMCEVIDVRLATDVGRNARSTVESKYSWAKLGTLFGQLYETVLKEVPLHSLGEV